MAQLLIFIANLSCCATSFVETTKLEARTRHSNVIRCSKVRAISRRSISTVIHVSLFRSMFFLYMFNLFVLFIYSAFFVSARITAKKIKTQPKIILKDNCSFKKIALNKTPKTDSKDKSKLAKEG